MLTGAAGEDGLSAYQLYLQEYANKNNGSTDGALSLEDWLLSLKGETGTSGESYWESNSQGLAYYLKDDGTFAVGVGQAILLSNIVVPESYLGITVTQVIEEGFAGCKYLKNITLPNTIETISDNAFANCTSLESVTIGDTVLTNNNVITFNGEFSSLPIDTEINFGKTVFLNTFMTVNIEDSSDSDTLTNIVIKNAGDDVDSISISAALNSVTDIGIAEISIDLTDRNNYSGIIDLGTYGLFKEINISTYVDESVSAKIEHASGVAITADEYNFAHENGSYPVLVFSLLLDEITQSGEIPTFVALERTAQYDWDKLPYNMKMMPFATEYDASVSTAFHHLRQGIAEYINELYTLNPKSKFNLYIVDNYLELILQYFVANNIPESNYTVTLLSDGNGTAGILSSTFASEDTDSGYQVATQKYDEMKANWQQIKEYFWDSGEYSNDELYNLVKYVNYSNSTQYSLLDRYAYILAREEDNVVWWVNRFREAENLAAINNTFATEIRGYVTEYNTNSLLTALTDEELNNFVALYKFNDEMFKEAE